MGTRRSGVFVGSKEEGVEANKEYNFNDVGLGLSMQEAEEPCRMSLHHHNNPSTPSYFSGGVSGSGSGSGSGDFGCDGSMFCGASNHVGVAYLGDIYDVVGAASSSGSGSDAVALAAVSKSFAFNHLGEMAPSVNVRVPFTAAQSQELERQTMIYKYMMASVPVPPELLLPITKYQSNSPHCQSNTVAGSIELGISSYGSDPEPWRCKRTDGKKWRCSRDVAPDQKYCERHSHKSRPRSRKPVELNSDSIANNKNYITNTHLFNQKAHFANQTNSHLSMFPNAMASIATSFDQCRSLEWFLKGETVPVASTNSNQEWQHLKRDSNECNDKVYNFQDPYRQEQLNANLYVNLRGSHSFQAHQGLNNDQCSLLLSQTQAHETRHFIDATTMREDGGGIENKGSVSSSEKFLPHSSLTLSMSGGSETNEDNENPQVINFGLMGSDTESVGVMRPQWMSHGSWMNSPPGGPLAEALCLGISNNAKTGSNLASTHGNSWETSTNFPDKS